MLYCSLKSCGLTAWLWLSKNASQAKAAVKPLNWPGLFGLGLAWLTASGRALQSTISHPSCQHSIALFKSTLFTNSVWKSGPVRFFGQISTDRNRNRLPIMARPQITGPDRK